MKTILYIHQYFKTPLEGGAIRSYYVAQAMIKDGYRVIMLTAHNQPKQRRINIDGIEVIYLPVSYSPQMSFLRRSLAFIKFITKGMRASLSIKPDIIFATSTPLSVGFLPFIHRFVHHTPFIFEVRDLWPEAPVQLGIIKNRLIIKMARAFERQVYLKSKHIIALSPGNKKYIDAQTGDASKCTLVPNMSDCDFFSPQRSPQVNSIHIVYTGSLGLVNDVPQLAQLIEYTLEHNDKVRFTIAGDGADAYIIEMLSKKIGGGRLKYEKHLNKNEIREALSIADISLIHFKKLPALRNTSPNKFFDTIAAGCVIAFNDQHWLSEHAAAHHYGFVFSSPTDFCEQLLRFQTNPKDRFTFKQQARLAAESDFNKQSLTKKITRIIASIEN